MNSTARRVPRITGLPARISGSTTMRSESGIPIVYRAHAGLTTRARGRGIGMISGGYGGKDASIGPRPRWPDPTQTESSPHAKYVATTAVAARPAGPASIQQGRHIGERTVLACMNPPPTPEARAAGGRRGRSVACADGFRRAALDAPDHRRNRSDQAGAQANFEIIPSSGSNALWPIRLPPGFLSALLAPPRSGPCLAGLAADLGTLLRRQF
jgi:hypothetical protein